jgi:signal transduction histidine kinase/HAMP domain-containing protein
MKPYVQINWFRNLSIAMKLYLVIGIMTVLIFLELGTLLFAMHTLSSIRAFVGEEGLWSKAQKDAIYHLRKYYDSHDEQAEQEFYRFLLVPLGDHKTLLELSKTNPDLRLARQGFLEGHNHPEDIDGMIKLVRRFHSISYIHQAIRIWAEGDSIITHLTPIAIQLHAEINSPVPSQKKLHEIISQLDPINMQLTRLEDDFSYTLGKGSRWLESIILVMVFSMAITVEVSGLLLSVSVSRGITKGLNDITRVINTITAGTLTERVPLYSTDEIGYMSLSINQMAEQLEKERTATQQSEEILRQSEEKFNRIFQLSPLGITLSETETGELVDVNESYLKLSGYTREEVIGHASLELNLVSKEERARILGEIKEVFTTTEIDLIPADESPGNKPPGQEQKTLVPGHAKESGSIKNLEVAMTKKNGETIYALNHYEQIEFQRKKYLLTIVQDITRRKKAEFTLQQKSEELMRSNKELEQFAYISSHDLQEPLRTISNFVGLFKEEYKKEPDQHAAVYLDFISAATTRMQSLIFDLLNYSRIGRNKTISSIDCNKLVQDILLDLSASIEESKAVITIEPLPTLNGYPELKSLFQNLISNAIKFKRKETHPVVHISARETISEWVFSIQDNGIGIEKQYFERIFTIFQRLQAQQEYPGTGIGLAQCKKIAELHHGKIWIESEPGTGSTFYFTLSKTPVQ